MKHCPRFIKPDSTPSVKPTDFVGYSHSSDIAVNSQSCSQHRSQPPFNVLSAYTGMDSESAVQAASIAKKNIRWADSKNIKLEHPEVTICGPRQSKVKCCFCPKMVTLCTRMNKNGSCGWIISNYSQHLAEHERPKRTATINDFFGHTKRELVTYNEKPEDVAEDRSEDVAEEEKNLSSQGESEIQTEEQIDNGEGHYNLEDFIEYDPQSDEEKF